MGDFTHFDTAGKAHMVDVGGKEETLRTAVAEGQIHMQPATLEAVLTGDHRKGDVLGVARVAGIMAAKRTADLIPLCHPLELSSVSLEFEPHQNNPMIRCRATVQTRGRTGVEMEALMAVQVALLTIYDMCKAMERGMVMDTIRLVEKSGGRSGDWRLSNHTGRGQRI